MAMKITDMCTSCGDCEPVCPTTSISVKKGLFVIDKNTCTECEGDFDSPKCVEVCPIDGCIEKLVA